jgi:pullulanase/glycogen debranching enzyme
LVSAFWTGRFEGIAELSRDWETASLPPLELASPGRLRSLARLEEWRWARLAGYCVEGGAAQFMLWPELYPNIDFQEATVRVAGTFNHWQPGPEWSLHPEERGGGSCLVLRVPAEFSHEEALFKFVTDGGVWLEAPAWAPNGVRDPAGNHNLAFSPERTGRHAFRFVSETPAHLAGADRLFLRDADGSGGVVVHDGNFLLQQDSALRMGALVGDGATVFRLFAPRAEGVVVEFWPPDADADGDAAADADADAAADADADADVAANAADDAAAVAPGRRVRHALALRGDGVWEAECAGVGHGWRYQFFVEGENADTSTAFDAAVPVLDPYARAALGPAGPGLVLREWGELPARQGREQDAPATFAPPALTDAVVVEAHVRDLLGGRPGGFRELAAWIRSPDCYLRRLGANVLELLPVTEYERGGADEYHWGYMPVNWFAPASAYASAPGAASHEEDFADLVAACHEAGISVVLDVVYNHCGNPNPLLHTDKAYYLETGRDGELTNWSGCGCDLRPAAPMARRLVVESLRHFLTRYDVDGFRFDLAELVGLPLLRQIERELRPLKPGLLLIAEPWSFRGHIGGALTRTGYASWNDGFREFLPSFVHNAGGADLLRHFLAGSPGTTGAHPFHTLNYTQSHDDHCWLDRITENAANNGAAPTAADARRTRVMFAVLMASLGVPMLAAGQDFLHSKHGAKNTYQRGDLNALDYARLARFRGTHEYVCAWVAFRFGPGGAALRQALRPAEGFWEFWEVGGAAGQGVAAEVGGASCSPLAADNTPWPTTGNALAALYNADSRLPVPRLLFAVNPAPYPVRLAVGIRRDSTAAKHFRQIADADTFLPGGLPVSACFPWRAGFLELPALSVGLWLET